LETLELLAIVHDGELQRMRVAGMCAVRPIKEVRVYSPTLERRLKFCREMSEKQRIEVKPVDSPN
jgi:ornithine cyclodeaminase/alanine dehydrogenase-like protein (mu-crystallin family)